jgi:hypothetical protein
MPREELPRNLRAVDPSLQGRIDTLEDTTMKCHPFGFIVALARGLIAVMWKKT